MNILNSPQESCYFVETNRSIMHESSEFRYFDDHYEKEFLENLNIPIEKQFGYSKIKDSDYLYLTLVSLICFNDGSCGPKITNTFLTSKNNLVKDVNDNKNSIDDNLCVYIHHAYHPLPDGRVIEFRISQDYVGDIDGIYKNIKKVRDKFYSNRKNKINF